MWELDDATKAAIACAGVAVVGLVALITGNPFAPKSKMGCWSVVAAVIGITLMVLLVLLASTYADWS